MRWLKQFIFGIIFVSLSTIADSGIDSGVVPSPNQAIQNDQTALSADASAASTEAVTITFNDYPVNTPITDQYQEQGVVFEQAFIELDNLPDIIYLSGDNESFPSPYGNGVHAAPITAAFTAPTNFIEADPIYLDPGGQMIADVYDKDGALISHTQSDSRIRVEADGIKKAVFSFTYPNTASGIDDIAGIDNLRFKPEKPVVVLDPGHGLLLGDDGRKHYQRPETSTFGLHEDNLTLAMANEAKRQLEDDEYQVVMTRSGSDATRLKPCGTPDPETDIIDYCNDDLKDRVAIARDTKDKIGDTKKVLFVSIHTNGGSARSLNGRTQTFYCFDAAKTLADLLLDEISAIAPPVFSLFTGGYRDCEIAVIAKTAGMDIPGSLVEVLYHSHPDDETLLNDPAFLSQAGSGIAKGIKDYIEKHL